MAVTTTISISIEQSPRASRERLISMKLCSGCQTKLPDNWKGLCTACKADRNKPVCDDIKSNVAAHRVGVYGPELDKQNKSRKWIEYTRPRILKRDPMCKRCDVELSEIVDHVVPAAIAVEQARESKRWPFDAWVGYYLETNLQGLCRGCHGKKTADDMQRKVPWPNILDEYDKRPKKVWSF
jgi:5-methylcytosine-specific restriction endonuclease McrA